MLTIIISRSDLKLGHVGSKTRFLGQQATQVSDLGPLWPSCFLEENKRKTNRIKTNFFHSHSSFILLGSVRLLGIILGVNSVCT